MPRHPREIAKEIREQVTDSERLDYCLRLGVHVWNEELGYSVRLESREMIDQAMRWDAEDR